MGVAPKRLRGWEPREFTEYRYENGVLVGTITTREPEFDPEQVAMLQAVTFLDADIGPHGQPMSEATAAEANPDAAGPYHYEANRLPKIDWAERALEQSKAAYYKSYPDADKAGHVWSVRKVEA